MTRVHHPIFARVYTALTAAPDERGDAIRRELLAGLRGRVIEIGAGTGANFPHYPDTVEEVVAVEPERYLRERAQSAAADAPVPVRVLDGTADALPAGDGELDAAVASLVLCSVPDPARALAEARRVLRPGGELRFYEHVAARDPRLRRTQAVLAPIWRRLAGGCHIDREPLADLERAGFALLRARHFPFAASLLTKPVTPHVLGAARRP